jgi:Ni/Fe-hydrogenase 1 B-type cytochrome subunit
LATEVKRVRVWPAVIRLTHWAMTLSLLVLLPTGWLLTTGLIANEELYQLLRHDLHEPAGHVLAVALAVRLAYLVVGGSGLMGWKVLLPITAPQRAGVREMARFYSALSSRPLPGYFAHNPLWAPLYLIAFALLAAAAATGLMLELPFLQAVAHVEEPAVLRLHGRLMEWILVWCVFHVAAAMLHDWRGQGSDVSALISGYRIFPVERQASPPPGAVEVPLAGLGLGKSSQRGSNRRDP